MVRCERLPAAISSVSEHCDLETFYAGGVTPLEALERVMHCLDRAHDTGFKAKAFGRALDVVRSTSIDELSQRNAAGTLTQLTGIGDSSARVIAEAFSGSTAYLDTLDAKTQVPISTDGVHYRVALQGDCHLHSRWSDGGATVAAMAHTARDLGHRYIVLTDHSPRLTIAHGLSKERLDEQINEVAHLNVSLAPFRILTGIEVDILEDGTLDHDDSVLAGLDVVVASVHSKLKMDHDAMTARMVRAVSSPHVDILGHCTGRLIDKRDPSSFDADAVFAACAHHRTAVEINCRPERLDPPEPLLHKAIEHGCEFVINSDAHATGQLEWQPFGCDKAAAAHVPLDRIINTKSADELLAWASAR
jgi:putative hydrolase